MLSQKKQSKKIIYLSLILVLLLLCGASYAVAYSATNGAGSTKANSAGNTKTNSASVTKTINARVIKATNTSVTKVPDHLPFQTAKADAVTQIDKPNVEISIGQYAAVKMVPTTSKEFTVDYPDTLYRASVINTKGNWKVHIDYIGTASKYPAAILHIPSIAYGDVSIKAKEATVYFNNVFQNVSQISMNLGLSSVFIPSHFKGKVKGDVSDGYLELNSDGGSLKLNSNGNGHLKMRSNGGSLELNSDDGSLKLNSNGGGHLKMRSKDGSLELNSGDGSLKLDSDDGSLKLNSDDGSLKLDSDDGSLKLDSNGGGHLEMHSNDGHRNSGIQMSGFNSIGNIIRNFIKLNDDGRDYDSIDFNGTDSDGTQTGGFHLNVGGISINIK